ncbi:MAG: peptide chain release factor N(5)-glutamine methyltransferase [Ilumatobacter sp.]|nr:peptide chain release factor N(5)-glutamine methyltransferase [Ilumatobacter sp.]
MTTRPDTSNGIGHEHTVSWRELLLETGALLNESTHARWICETASATTPAEFRKILDEPAARRAVTHLDAMVARARAGEPIQYVLGSWAFRHLDLAVDERVLIPRPETELVAEIAIGLARASGPNRAAVDLGTGSGAIGLAMADELPHVGTRVWITDVSPDAVAVARDNLAGLGRSAVNVSVAEGSWFEALPDETRFDVIVSNPPYVADTSVQIDHIVSEWEPAAALFAGPDGLDALRTIVQGAPRRLRPGGWLVLEHGFDQGDTVRELMSAAGMIDTATRCDFAGHDRVSLGRSPSHLFNVAWEDGDLAVRHLHNTTFDYADLLRWLSAPQVLNWYEGREMTDLAAVLTEYGPGGRRERHGITTCIIELDEHPVGYVQFSELGDSDKAAAFDLVDGRGVWSLDFLLGRPDLFGLGVDRAVCRAVAEFLIAERCATDVVLLPYIKNARLIAAYREAGFAGDHVVRGHELHEGVVRDAVRLHFRH